MRHLHTVLIVGISSVVAAKDAEALSFGKVRSALVLGQTVSVAVPIVLSPGEDEVLDECVRAEVLHGDSLLPANQVRARVTRGSDDATRVIRVSSTSVVEEPIVTVTVHAGCPSRLSRSFTLLADPPTTLARTSAPIAVPAPAERPAQASPALIAATGPSAGARQAAPRRDPAPRRAVPPAETRPAPEGSTPASAAPPQVDAVARRTAGGGRGRAPEAERSRLQLESGSVSTGSGAPVMVPDPAASAALASAQAAQSAASAAEGRVKTLEAEVERLRATTKDQADSIVKLQARVNQPTAQANDWGQWLPWVAGLAGLSTALALWLAWRVRRLAAESQRNAWWIRENQSSLLHSRVTEADDAASMASMSPRASVSHVPMPPASEPKSGFAPSTVVVAPETVPAPVAPSAQVTLARQPSRAPSMQSDMQVDTHRAVSVDEQIDLEQQADFFIALGHDDAAVDLLLAHLRSTGGAAPIPYLKLLEMYRRRGDRDDYEVMRRRFNQRFNSVAPEWDDYGQAGRPLIEYPKQVARLQAVWPNPLDAMAELEAMAFGRGSEQELFDLPAYQDVLFLYQLARQLHEDSSQGKGTGVDVLLPIGGETAPAPLLMSLHDPEVNSTVMGSLDLDVSTDQGALEPAALRAMASIDLDLPRKKH